jgi:hypothetical protein
VGGAKALLAFSKDLRRDSMLSLHLRMTTADEIRDGVVAKEEKETRERRSFERAHIVLDRDRFGSSDLMLR